MFDRDFMQAAFDRFWAGARHATRWTNAMLAPPPARVLDLLGAAGRIPAVAHRFANGFDDPADLDQWFYDPDRAAAHLGTVTPRG
ncbi:hypothetical protein [Kitasatospora sp. NPDC088351]|uniref:hypothetical protein n=1 Tax=unclassified Kitasatospora TaxID=2633591 RepID=UPI00341D48EA